MLSAEQNSKIKITGITCSEEYFLLLMDILPSWEMWKDRLKFTSAASETVTGSAAICCGPGLLAPGADSSLLMPKTASLLLQPVEAECHWYDYLGRGWELYLSCFPRMQLGTNLQEPQFTFSNYRVAEWRESICSEQGDWAETPFQHRKGQMLVIMLQISSEQRPQRLCRLRRLHAAPRIFLNTRSKHVAILL